MRTHKAARAFPDMDAQKFAELKADIEKHGLICPIETLDGQILDGRHRLKACIELKVEPEFCEAALNGQTPEEYVWSLNTMHRDLTKSQRAAVAEILWPAEKAKVETQVRGKGKKGVAKLPPQKSRDAVGKKVGVSGRYVSDAARLKKDSPELFDEVKQGTKTLQQAKREVNPQRPKRKAKYPLSTAIWEMMENVTASAAMVEKDYNNDIETVLNHAKFDPDKRLPVAQLVVSFVDTLKTWEKSCSTIIKRNSAKSETSSSTNTRTAKGRRRKK